MNKKKEYGDYQTPIEFAQKICKFLKEEKKISPQIVIEPTCGVGNILRASLMFEASEYYGIEINPMYCEQCRKDIADKRVHILEKDFFSFDVREVASHGSNVLIIGNPPWVTNSTLSVLESRNLPVKSNFKQLKGIDAVTGASNFDICEYIILQLIRSFKGTEAAIAMLCKTSVARNVFAEMKRSSVEFEYFELIEFDANKVFGISASACLLLIKLSLGKQVNEICTVYTLESKGGMTKSISYENGRLCSRNRREDVDFEGKCCFEWRQGIKHDCSKVMELTIENGKKINGNREVIDIEDEFVFPLVKSSMFKLPIIDSFKKQVVVTQHRVGEETRHIQGIAPRTWNYLNENYEAFRRRKSSIYHNAPEFSMFGVGDYSYAKYKVGVSGFYKEPLFSVLFSPDGKPVMTDDTSYFICFENFEMAYVAMLLLNSQAVQEFLKSIAFLDAKRPYTKKVLERISFKKIITYTGIEELRKTEDSLNIEHIVTAQMYRRFEQLLEISQETQLAFA